MTTVSGPADTDTEADSDQAEGSESARDGDGTDSGKAQDNPLMIRSHRLRELTSRERWWALLLGLAVVMPTVVALVHLLPDWRASSDPGLMALRTLDVGTSRTPLVGQPSTSSTYAGPEVNVYHPGPLHFYMMAPFVRLLGASIGMLLTSACVSGFMALVTLWVAYRRLGKAAAVLAAVALSVVLFGMGAAALLNPVSSSFSGLPLFASAMLVWAVLAGDIKLLPLAMGVLVFTAEVHLAVGPTVAFLCLILAGAIAVQWRLQRQAVLRAAGWSLVVAGVLFAPLVIQELWGQSDRGNLSALLEYILDSESNGTNLGAKRALWSLVHVMGLPPVLANTQLAGWDLLEPPSLFTWVTAVGIAVLLGALLVHWGRKRDLRVTLVLMAGSLALAGLINGSRIPAGLESGRLAFYHWMWPFTFFALLSLFLAVPELARAVRTRLPDRFEWGPTTVARVRPWAAGAVAAALIAVPIANNTLDRPTNNRGRMHMTFAGTIHDQLTDLVLSAEDDLPESGLLLVSRSSSFYTSASEALAVSLEEEGLDVLWLPSFVRGVHNDRIAWHRDQVNAVLVATINTTPDVSPTDTPGELLGRVPLWPERAVEAYELLKDQAQAADEVIPDPNAEPIRFPGSPEDYQAMLRANLATAQENLPTDPDALLTRHEWLQQVMEYPLIEPELDPDALAQVHAALTDTRLSSFPTVASIDVHLVTDPAEVDTFTGTIAS